MTPDEFAGQMSVLVTPFIAMLVGLVITLWVKDFAVSIAKGLSFKLFGPFKEGDKALLDGRPAVVVKIGMTSTVFGVQEEDDYIWRYGNNDKISGFKIGKVIINHNRL